MAGNDRAYLCPEPFYRQNGEWLPCDPADLLDWAKSCITDSRSYLRLQPAYQYIQEGIDLVNGEYQRSQVQTLSNVRTETTVRNTKEIVAAQTNIRIVPAFKSEMEEFREQNAILNKSFMSWQQMTFADREIRRAWQYASVAGTGYNGLRYDPNYYYRGKGDMVLDSYGPMDVLPLGMPSDHDLHKAYVVALRKALPIHEAWRMFPMNRDLIVPNRTSGVYGRGTVVAQAVKFASAVIKRFGQGARRENEAATWDTVDCYWLYVDDDSINETGRELEVRGPDGQYGTSWSYKVPYYGQELPDKIVNGAMQTRQAKREDCLLYPNKRLVVVTDYAVMNPDPLCQASYYWHAKTPVVKFTADDWAWNYLGFPVTRYGTPIEKAGIEVWRGMIDAINNRLNPATAFDSGSGASSIFQSLNLRIPGQRLPFNNQLTGIENALRPLLPPNFWDFPNHFIQVAADIFPRIIKDQMGLADASALARARQLPAGDTTEKLLEAMGPLPKDQSRSMEKPICQLGEMWKSGFFQFITARRRLELMGPDGLSDEDFDYDPGTLIPQSEPPESHVSNLVVKQFERARWHKDNFTFTVTPYNLHEMNSITRKLFHLQLKKSGFPLDPWTEAELFDVKNFGALPNYDDPVTGESRPANTILERWVCWMEIQSRMQQALAQAGGGQPGGKQKGRPPTGQTAPTLEQKKGGTDSTIRESKH